MLIRAVPFGISEAGRPMGALAGDVHDARRGCRRYEGALVSALVKNPIERHVTAVERALWCVVGLIAAASKHAPDDSADRRRPYLKNVLSTGKITRRGRRIQARPSRRARRQLLTGQMRHCPR